MSQIKIIEFLKSSKGNKFTASQIRLAVGLHTSGSSRMLMQLRDFKLIKGKRIKIKLGNGLRPVWHYWI